jgi:hypothetical protein
MTRRVGVILGLAVAVSLVIAAIASGNQRLITICLQRAGIATASCGQSPSFVP